MREASVEQFKSFFTKFEMTSFKLFSLTENPSIKLSTLSKKCLKDVEKHVDGQVRSDLK